jgi:hypothetical protein
MAGNGKNHVQVTMATNIFVDPRNRKRICKWTASAASTKDDAHLFTYDGKPGFKDTYSCDPDSADYDPANFNRCLTLLHERGISLDVPLAPIPHSRMLRERWPLLSLKLKREIVRRLLHA